MEEEHGHIATEIKIEQNTDDSDEEPQNSMSLFEMSRIIKISQEPLQFNSTDAMMDPKSGLMVCLLCYKKCDPKDLSAHLIETHAYRQVLFKCINCNTKFLKRTQLIAHKGNCGVKPTKKKKLRVQQVLREVETKEFLDEQEDIMSCPFCFVMVSKYDLKKHLLAEHKKVEESQNCSICDRAFKNKMTLRDHVRLVHEAIEDSVHCNLCDQKFKSSKYLQNHRRNVHPSGSKVHLCDICGKGFKSHLCLYQHNRNVHPPPSAAVECTQCHLVYKCLMNYRQHMRIAHGIGPK